MKPLGSDGKPIPFPPGMVVPWQTRLLSYAAQSLGIALVVFVVAIIRSMSAYKAILDTGWSEVARRFALLIGIAVCTGVLAVFLCTLVAAAFWPWSRKDFGKKLERQIAGLGEDQLAEEISAARYNLENTTGVRLRTAWAEWLAWLQTQKEMRPTAEVKGGPNLPPIREWIIGPALRPQIAMACIGVPFLALAIWVAVEAIRDQHITWVTAGSALVVAGLGGWCIGEISTVRIQLTPEYLLMRQFWRVRWSVARERANLLEGMVGDGVSLPGYRVFDVSTSELVGTILKSQFRPVDLERLVAMFPARR